MKTRPRTVRLSEEDEHLLKAAAAKEGAPYSSLLRAGGRLVARAILRREIEPDADRENEGTADA